MFESLTALQLSETLPSGGRALHLIDFENLVGSTSFDLVDALEVRIAYEFLTSPALTEHIVLATSPYAASTSWRAWPPNIRRLVRSGPNGADLELLRVIRNERIAQRYDRVVVGSGDGIFSFAAAQLQAAGCAVTVVSRRESLSCELRLAVRDVRFLDLPVRDDQAMPITRVAA